MMIQTVESASDDGCCEQLAAAQVDERVPVDYNPKVREWSVKMLDIGPDGVTDWRGSTAGSLLIFCPFCASELPSSLRDEWFDTLEELGFEDPLGREDLPEEFQSDRWWTNGRD